MAIKIIITLLLFLRGDLLFVFIIPQKLIFTYIFLFLQQFILIY